MEGLTKWEIWGSHLQFAVSSRKEKELFRDAQGDSYDEAEEGG